MSPNERPVDEDMRIQDRSVGREILDAQVAAERLRYQPTKMEKFMAMAKSLILRGLCLYFLASFIQRPKKGPASTDDAVPNVNAEESTKAHVLLYTYVFERINSMDFPLFVSILHFVLQLLAFKGDIHFWSTHKSYAGLSILSVAFSVFHHLVILLHVLGDETGLLVRIGCCLALCVDLWKIYKMVRLEFDRKVIPRLSLNDSSGSYEASGTRSHDRKVFKYLCAVLVACYCYSLAYQRRNDLNGFYKFLLTLGFLTVTPQLYINYKMKSVANLPWGTLKFNALNAFIFHVAFVFGMPALFPNPFFSHDVAFLILCYQSHIYKLDPKGNQGLVDETLRSKSKSTDVRKSAKSVKASKVD